MTAIKWKRKGHPGNIEPSIAKVKAILQQAYRELVRVKESVKDYPLKVEYVEKVMSVIAFLREIPYYRSKRLRKIDASEILDYLDGKYVLLADPAPYQPPPAFRDRHSNGKIYF